MTELKLCLSDRNSLSSVERDSIAEEVLSTYEDSCGINNIEGSNLPSQQDVLEIITKLLDIIFPGYVNPPCSRVELPAIIRMQLEEIELKLFDQIYRALRHQCNHQCDDCQTRNRAKDATRAVLSGLSRVRESMKLDVSAAYAGDPAASSRAEIVLSYPFIKAITIQRIAHTLYLAKIPLLPRMMTEYGHSTTGIDIHPGAQLGKGLFIDHGTGVVVGETAILGDNIRIYQGVTLGALSFPKDACGMLIKGKKRHPTIEDNVTIYAGATVLGDIVIGSGSVIGGNVWVVESLPPRTKISAKLPELVVKNTQK